MFERTELLLGEETINEIKKQKILIVGIGGVGGIALNALVRTGFSNITIIDYDTFEISNLNRQILSDNLSIGLKKVEVAKRKMLEINKDLNIKALDIFLDKDNIQDIGTFDYIIDSCDSVDTKLELYKYATENNIKIISSMGMGNRVDLSKIGISRLDRTLNDPLAKKLRFLCKRNNINSKIPVVSSTELPRIDKKIASIFPVTNTAGIHLANYIINDVIKQKE
ncbi:MAG: ThiF family adenylyltransferase [bacterium]